MNTITLRSLAWLVLANAAASVHAAEFRGQVRLNEPEGMAVANVEVYADGANPTSTDNDGRFELVFPNKQPGDSVEIDVKSEAYVVIHHTLCEHVWAGERT